GRAPRAARWNRIAPALGGLWRRVAGNRRSRKRVLGADPVSGLRARRALEPQRIRLEPDNSRPRQKFGGPDRGDSWRARSSSPRCSRGRPVAVWSFGALAWGRALRTQSAARASL